MDSTSMTEESHDHSHDEQRDQSSPETLCPTPITRSTSNGDLHSDYSSSALSFDKLTQQPQSSVIPSASIQSQSSPSEILTTTPTTTIPNTTMAIKSSTPPYPLLIPTLPVASVQPSRPPQDSPVVSSSRRRHRIGNSELTTPRQPLDSSHPQPLSQHPSTTITSDDEMKLSQQSEPHQPLNNSSSRCGRDAFAETSHSSVPLSNTSDNLTIFPNALSPRGPLIANYYTPGSTGTTQLVQLCRPSLMHQHSSTSGPPTLLCFQQSSQLTTNVMDPSIRSSNHRDHDAPPPSNHPLLHSQESTDSMVYDSSLITHQNNRGSNTNKSVSSLVPNRSIPPLAIQAAVNLSSLRIGTPRTPHTPVSTQAIYPPTTPHLLLQNGAIPIRFDNHPRHQCHSGTASGMLVDPSISGSTAPPNSSSGSREHLMYHAASSSSHHFHHASTLPFTPSFPDATTVWTTTSSQSTPSESNNENHNPLTATQLCLGFPQPPPAMTSFLLTPRTTTPPNNQPPMIYEGTPVCLQDQQHQSTSSPSSSSSPLPPPSICCLPLTSPETTPRSASLIQPMICHHHHHHSQWTTDPNHDIMTTTTGSQPVSSHSYIHSQNADSPTRHSSDQSSLRNDSCNLNHQQPQQYLLSSGSTPLINSNNISNIDQNDEQTMEVHELNYDRMIDSASSNQQIRDHYIHHQPIDDSSMMGLCEQTPVRLFVGRIPKAYRSSDLKKIFDGFGIVLECNIIRDRRSSQSKGCGFVKLPSIECAKNAITALNQTRQLDADLGPLQVKFASGELERLGLPLSIQPGGECVKVFFGNLAPTTTEEELRSIFGQFGEYEELCVLRDRNRRSKCSGFITFRSMNVAQLCIANLDNQHQVLGAPRRMEVRLAESRTQRGNKTAVVTRTLPSNEQFGSSILRTIPKPTGHDNSTSSMTRHSRYRHNHNKDQNYPNGSRTPPPFTLMSNSSDSQQTTSSFYDHHSPDNNNDEWMVTRSSTPTTTAQSSSSIWNPSYHHQHQYRSNRPDVYNDCSNDYRHGGGRLPSNASHHFQHRQQDHHLGGQPHNDYLHQPQTDYWEHHDDQLNQYFTNDIQPSSYNNDDANDSHHDYHQPDHQSSHWQDQSYYHPPQHHSYQNTLSRPTHNYNGRRFPRYDHHRRPTGT